MPSDRDYEVNGLPVRITNWGGWPYRSHLALQFTLSMADAGSEAYQEVLEWFERFGEEIHAVMTYEEYGDSDSKPGQFLELVAGSRFAGYQTREAALKDLRSRRGEVRETRQPADPSGYVYLIGSTDGLYKIGKSVNPSSRLKSLQSGNPRELTLLHTQPCSDMHALEAALHRRFARFRIGTSEWFRLDSRDVASFGQTARKEATSG